MHNPYTEEKLENLSPQTMAFIHRTLDNEAATPHLESWENYVVHSNKNVNPLYGQCMSKATLGATIGVKKYEWNETERLLYLTIQRNLIQEQMMRQKTTQPETGLDTFDIEINSHGAMVYPEVPIVTICNDDFALLHTYWTEHRNVLQKNESSEFPLGELSPIQAPCYQIPFSLNDNEPIVLSQFFFFQKEQLDLECQEVIDYITCNQPQDEYCVILHTDRKYHKDLMQICLEKAEKLKEPFSSHEQFLCQLGELFYLVCQTKPWVRGDPSIAEMWIKSIALEHDLELPQWKKDLFPWVELMKYENMESFGKDFHTLFAHTPNFK